LRVPVDVSIGDAHFSIFFVTPSSCNTIILLIVGKTRKDKCMLIKTDYIYCMIDNVTEETQLQYINNLPNSSQCMWKGSHYTKAGFWCK
jgi:hypothetical protein